MKTTRISRTYSPNSLATLLGTTAAVLALGGMAPAQNRNQIPPGGSNWVRQQSILTGLVTQDMATGGVTAASLVQALVGAGVTTSNITFNGAPIAAGTFSGGTGIVGFAQGIILSSGNIGSVVGPANLSASTSTDNLMPGDADLDALVTGFTQDASGVRADLQDLDNDSTRSVRARCFSPSRLTSASAWSSCSPTPATSGSV